MFLVLLCVILLNLSRLWDLQCCIYVNWASCLKLPSNISACLPVSCYMRKKQYESWSVTDHTTCCYLDQRYIIRGRSVFCCLIIICFLFSSLLWHTEVLHWSVLNPISNKTRCPASSPGVTTTITEECMLFSSSPLITPFGDFICFFRVSAVVWIIFCLVL